MATETTKAAKKSVSEKNTGITKKTTTKNSKTTKSSSSKKTTKHTLVIV